MNEIVNRKNMQKEEMNKSSFPMSTEEQKYALYLAILMKGVELELITKDNAENINQRIMSTVMDKADENLNKMGNIFYIISWYLRNQKQWSDAFEKITELSPTKLISEAITELVNKAKLTVNKLKALQKSVYDTKNDFLIMSYHTILFNIEKLMTPVTSKEKFANEHTNAIMVEYIFVTETETEIFYFDNVFKMAGMFIREIQIFNKFDLNALLKDFESGYLTDIQQLEKEEAKIKAKYEKKLATWQKNYNAKKASMKDDEIAFEKIKYLLIEKKEKILQELDDALENLAVQNNEVSTYSLLGKKLSLHDIFKMYYIFFKASNGEINYPTSLNEKEKLLFEISFNDALAVVLANADNLGLTESDCNYLKNSI